ncbi:hypothetical protein Golomagni_03905, partial [Golovinomyces magnicellulatus]
MEKQKPTGKKRGPGCPRKESLTIISIPDPPEEPGILSQVPSRSQRASVGSDPVTGPLMDMLNPDVHQIVTLQEPSVNKTTLGTYCPQGYVLCMESALETKVAFLIINIYSPITSKAEIIGWNTIVETISNNTMSCVIVGDFNCHHPLLGGITASRDNRAKHLLHSLIDGGLNLITPTSISTFRRRGRGKITQETVIDLAFVTEDLLARVNCCTTGEDWSLRNDHIPIDISLDLSNASEVESQRYAYKKADIDKVKEKIRQSNWYQSTDPLTVLQKAIVDGLLLHCPKRRSSIPARAECFPKATILLSDTRKARRQALQTGGVLDNLRYKQLRKELKKEI